MKKYFFPLRIKIPLIFLVFVLPLFIIFMIGYESDRGYLEGHELGHLRSVTDDIEDEFLMFIQMMENEVSEIAADGQVAKNLEAALRGSRGALESLNLRLTQEKATLMENVHNFSVISGGRVVASSDGAFIGTDLSRERFFKKIMGGSPVAERTRGFGGMPEVVFTAPVIGTGGKAIGLIAGFVPIKRIRAVVTGEYAGSVRQMYGHVKKKEEFETVMINGEKLIITGSEFPESPFPRIKADTAPVRACIEKGKEITGTFIDYRGVEVIGASLCFPEYGWAITVKTDKEFLFEPIYKMRKRQLLTGVSVAAALVAMVFILLNTVARRVREVSEAAGRIAAGDYGFEIPVRSRDEIGALSGSFNDMSRSIKERDAALQTTDETLKEQVALLATLIDTIPGPIFYTDTGCILLGCNRAFEEATGRKKNELIGKSISTALPPGLAEVLGRKDRDVFEGEGLVYEAVIRYPGGQGHDFIIDKERFLKKTGEAAGLICIMTDITEVKRAGMEVRKNLELLQGLIDNTKTLVIIRDVSERYLFVNKHFQTVVNLPRERIIGNTPYDIFPGETADVLTAISRQVRDSGEPMEFEVNIPTASGVRSFIQEMGPIYGGNREVIAVSAISTDITARKRTEEALRKSEADLANAQRIARVGSFRWEIGKALYGSEELYRILGIREGEFRDPEAFISAMVHPDDRQAVRGAIEAAIRTGEAPGMEYRVVRPDGAELTVYTEAEISFDQDGVPRAIAGVLQDITERKALERERQRIREQLEEDQKTKAMGELASGITHDFNNLLILIKINTRLALKEPVNEKVLRALTQISEATDRAAGLTRQLLIFSRSLPAEFTVIDLNETITGLLNILRRTIREDITITTELARGLWPVSADKVTIEQMIMNLVINARDAMPGGGEVVISTYNEDVDEKASSGMPGARPGRFVRVTVRDTGVGMDEEVLGRIFEPFFTTKGKKGTGLGLAVVHGAVREHQGWIRVLSAPGKGSSFMVYIPAMAEGRPQAKPQAAGEAEAAGRGERVLLIEDQPQLRRSIAMALSGHGYRVVEASSAKEALKVFEREEVGFDLVFSDMVLQDGNGVELFDELAKKRPGLRALFTSGYLDVETRWPQIRERGLHFLFKPYDLKDLLSAMKKALE